MRSGCSPTSRWHSLYGQTRSGQSPGVENGVVWEALTEGERNNEVANLAGQAAVTVEHPVAEHVVRGALPHGRHSYQPLV